MAMGKALVSTSIGAEGLDVKHGRDVLLADTPECFSDCVQRLLREPELRRSYERAATSLAARYDWSKITLAFTNVLRDSIAQFENRPTSLV
jgi:glycosyltransferase involved in cell wall biosynthesis